MTSDPTFKVWAQCVFNCLKAGPECSERCNEQYPEQHAELDAFAACGRANCQAACGH
jgi:hypothetical protein